MSEWNAALEAAAKVAYGVDDEQVEARVEYEKECRKEGAFPMTAGFTKFGTTDARIIAERILRLRR